MTLIHKNAPAVEFRQVAGLFIASFARPSFGLNDQETVDNNNKPTLTAREDELLRLLASTPRMTQKQLAYQLGLTERGVRYLKRILRKYKYPPDLQDGAVELVLQQAQVMGESWAV